MWRCFYDLLTSEARGRASRQASGTVRPAGLILASFIARYAGTHDPHWIVAHGQHVETIRLTSACSL